VHVVAVDVDDRVGAPARVALGDPHVYRAVACRESPMRASLDELAERRRRWPVVGGRALHERLDPFFAGAYALDAWRVRTLSLASGEDREQGGEQDRLHEGLRSRSDTTIAAADTKGRSRRDTGVSPRIYAGT